MFILNKFGDKVINLDKIDFLMIDENSIYVYQNGKSYEVAKYEDRETLLKAYKDILSKMDLIIVK